VLYVLGHEETTPGLDRTGHNDPMLLLRYAYEEWRIQDLD
jgi:hypothetical protein